MAAMEKIRFVCASRESKETFFTRTALGRSLSLFGFMPFMELRLFGGNAAGLPTVYNIAIDETRDDPAILVFIHDDVHLCDFYWASRMAEGLAQFQVLGVAGNRRRSPRQPSWAFVDDQFTWDSREHLSGVVGHGSGFPCSNLSVFGPPGQAVKLLDGLMLVTRSRTLHETGIRFDPRFDFHFYDLDFCRQAEAAGVTMGTWPFSVVHESGGNFRGEGWRRGYAAYLEKYGD